MSAATKKKYVYDETLNSYNLPTQEQSIVRIKAPRGNNLHDVDTPTGESYIVSMPTKFRNTVWIKRGDYVIVEPIQEGNKVKAEIQQILTKDHIKYIKSQGLWPKEFETTDAAEDAQADRDMFPSSSSENEDNED